MITFSDIHKNYNGKEIIADFNLTIESGTFVTIIGTSGSGKTTVLKMINGLVLPDKGEIRIDGKNIADENLIALRRNIGYVIQGNILFPHLSVAENIAYVLVLKNCPKSDISRIVAEKLQLVNLAPELAKRFPHELSGGQQQRVALARTLAQKASITLLDEPFSSVDATMRAIMKQEVLSFLTTTKSTIFIISHQTEDFEKEADDKIII